jgi:hypothetical protein
VSELENQERPPSTLRNIDGDPLGGADRDPGAPTINVKNTNGGHPGPRGGGGFGPYPGSKMCIVNLHRHDRQKVVLLTGLILPVLSFVMAHEWGMGNSVRHYLGYDLVQGHVSSRPPILSCQRKVDKVYTLRIHDQVKQAAHSEPPI